MGADQAPTVIHIGCATGIYDFLPWTIELPIRLAYAWILFGPVIVFFGARLGRTAASVVSYACGVVIAAGVIEPFRVMGNCHGVSDRLAALWRAGDVQFLGGVAVGLAVFAVLAGQWSRRRRARLTPS